MCTNPRRHAVANIASSQIDRVLKPDGCNPSGFVFCLVEDSGRYFLCSDDAGIVQLICAAFLQAAAND